MVFFTRLLEKTGKQHGNDDIQEKIKNTLHDLLPDNAEVTTRIENGKCVAIVENCSPESGDVDFNKIGPTLLKYAKKGGSVRMNWEYKPLRMGEFYRLSSIIETEKNIYKKLEACEESYPMLKEFCKYCIRIDNELPPVINCRDIGFELYMRLGRWEDVERVFAICENANAYYPNHGEDEQNYLIGYKNIALSAIKYINENPGCLQKNIYKAMNLQDEDKMHLKHFLRCSLQIHKEKCGTTNKLYISTGENMS